MTQLTAWKSLQKDLNKAVRFVDRAGKFRALDAVVVEIGDGAKVDRTITMLTSGTQETDRDTRRVRRLLHRLKRMGHSELWHCWRHPMDGVGGTVRMMRPRGKRHHGNPQELDRA